MEGMAAVGNGGEGRNEDRGNGTGVRYCVQGSHAVSVVIWELELGGDRDHAKSTRGIPSLGSEKDYEDDGAAYSDQRVGVPLGT